MPALSRSDLVEWQSVPTRAAADEEDEECTWPRWHELPDEWEAYVRWAGIAPYWDRG
jgi:hypothetical protein